MCRAAGQATGRRRGHVAGRQPQSDADEADATGNDANDDVTVSRADVTAADRVTSRRTTA